MKMRLLLSRFVEVDFTNGPDPSLAHFLTLLCQLILDNKQTDVNVQCPFFLQKVTGLPPHTYAHAVSSEGEVYPALPFPTLREPGMQIESDAVGET